MARVWRDFPGAGGSDLLAMLALADWSDDEGRCWPSMTSIADKTRLSRSQAQRVVHGLIADGYLSVIGNSEGGKPGTTRQYRINLHTLTGRIDATPTGRTDATGSTHATGRTDAAEGSHGCGERGRTGATQTINRTIKEPSAASRAPEIDASLSQPADQTREQAIAIWLRKAEKGRGKFLNATSSDNRIVAWAEHGVTDAQLAEAYELALADRAKNSDAGPINAGFLDIFVTKVLKPSAASSAVGSQSASRTPSDAWWASDAGIDRKGRELGMFARGGESYSAFKDRIFAELRKRGDSNDVEGA